MKLRTIFILLIIILSFNVRFIHSQHSSPFSNQVITTSFLLQKNTLDNNSDSSAIVESSRFWVSIETGVLYTPFLFENIFAQTINKTDPSFSFGISMTYTFNEYHSLNFGVRRFNTKITQKSIHLLTKSQFTGYPISLTYYYHLDEIVTNIKPFIGIGLIYIYIENDQINEEIESQPKIWESESNYSGYGIDGKFGLSVFLGDNFQLQTIATLQYINGAGFSNYSYNVIDFSGIHLSLGIGYNI